MVDYFHVELQQSIRLLLPLANTRGVITVEEEKICPIPGVMPCLLGVTNQDGKLLWMLELSQLFGLDQTVKEIKSNCILSVIISTNGSTNSIYEASHQQFCCVVSALRGIVSLDSKQLKPVPQKFLPSLSSLLCGAAEIEQHSSAILDVKATFSTLPNLYAS